MLTAEQQRLREGNFTASMAPVVMSDDTDLLLEKWRIAIGEIEEPPPNWPMRLGSYLEPFVLDYWQEKTGEALTRRGEVMQHPTLPNVSCTLDAFRAKDSCVIDAKVCNAWMKIDDIVAYYTPQIIVQQRCVGSGRGSLLIVHGTAEPREYEVVFDKDYERVLWERIRAFQLCVTTLTPPVAVKKVVPPAQYRTIDLDPDKTADWPNWADTMIEQFAIWDATKDATDQHSVATKEIKNLLPDDVGQLKHGNVNLTRNRAGAVTIKRG